METIELTPDLVFERPVSRASSRVSNVSPSFDLSASSFKIAKSMFEKPQRKSKTLERDARPKPKPRSRSYTLGSKQRHKSPAKPTKDQYGVSVSIKDIKGLPYVILEDNEQRHMVPAPNDDTISDINPPSLTYTVDDVDDEVKDLMDPESSAETPNPPEIQVESPKVVVPPKQIAEPEHDSIPTDTVKLKGGLLVEDVSLLSVSETADTNAEILDTTSETSQNIPDIPKDITEDDTKESTDSEKNELESEEQPELSFNEINDTDVGNKTEKEDTKESSDSEKNELESEKQPELSSNEINDTDVDNKTEKEDTKESSDSEKNELETEKQPELSSNEINDTDLDNKTEEEKEEEDARETPENLISNDKLSNLEKSENPTDNMINDESSKEDCDNAVKENDIEEDEAKNSETTLSNKSSLSDNESVCVGTIPEVKQTSSSSSSSSNSYSSDEKEAEISSDLEFYEKPKTEEKDDTVDKSEDPVLSAATNTATSPTSVKSFDNQNTAEANIVNTVCDNPNENIAEVVPENLQKKLENIINEIGEAALDDSNLIDDNVSQEKSEPEDNTLEENIIESENSTTEEIKSTPEKDIPKESSENDSSESEQEEKIEPVVVSKEKVSLPTESSQTPSRLGRKHKAGILSLGKNKNIPNRSRSLSPSKALDQLNKANRARSMSPPKKVRPKFAMVDENSTKPVSNLIGFFEDKTENVSLLQRRKFPDRSNVTSTKSSVSSLNIPQKEESMLPFIEAQKNLRKVNKQNLVNFDAPKPWNKHSQKELNITKPFETKPFNNDVPVFTETIKNGVDDDATTQNELGPKASDNEKEELLPTERTTDDNETEELLPAEKTTDDNETEELLPPEKTADDNEKEELLPPEKTTDDNEIEELLPPERTTDDNEKEELLPTKSTTDADTTIKTSDSSEEETISTLPVEVSTLKQKMTSPSKSIISKQKQRKINQLTTGSKKKQESSDERTCYSSDSSSSKSEESNESNKRKNKKRGRSLSRRTNKSDTDERPRKRSTSIKFIHINSRDTSKPKKESNEGSIHIEELENKIKQLQNLVENLQQQADQTKKENEDNARSKKLSEGTILKLEESLQEEKTNYENLNISYNNLKKRTVPKELFEKIESECDEKDFSLQKLKKKIENLKATNENLVSEKSEKDVVLKIRNNEINNLKKTIEEEMINYDNDIQNIKRMHKENDSRLKQENAKTTKTNSSLRCDNDKLYHKVSELENMLGDLKRENSNLSRQLKNKDKDINHLKENINNLEDKNEELERKRRINSNDSVVKDLTDKLEKIKNEKRNTDKKVSSQSRDLTDMEAQLYLVKEERDIAKRAVSSFFLHF